MNSSRLNQGKERNQEMNKTMHNFNFKRSTRKKSKEEQQSPQKKADKSQAALVTNNQVPMLSTLQTPKQSIQPFVSNAARLHNQDNKISKGGTTYKKVSRDISVMTAADQSAEPFIGPTLPDSFYSLKHPPTKLITSKPASMLSEQVEVQSPVQQVVI